MAVVRTRQGLPTDEHTLLSLFSTRIPDDPGGGPPIPTRVYVLGVCEPRVTLYSQQCRALNLIWLLHETRALSEGASIAVVGAGAGGLTAAAAAACKGHEVLLLNEARDVMPQQRLAWHRHLHPRIFDWPYSDWWNGDAELPLLSWAESSAHEVRQTIVEQFKAAPWSGEIDYRPGVRDVAIDPPQQPATLPELSWRSAGRKHTRTVEAIVLAVGFGSERTDRHKRPPLYQDSFWDDPGRRWTTPGKVLISGGGDGGLTEVLHAVFGDRFHHDQILELAGRPHPSRLRRPRPARWVGDVGKRIEPFERRWRQRRRLPQDGLESTIDFYGEIPLPTLDRALQQLMAEGERTAASEVKLAVDDDDLAVTSCVLNRFLVARLIHQDHVELVCGKLDVDDPAFSGGRPYSLSIGPSVVEANSVVVRHGPASPSPLSLFGQTILPALDPDLFGGPAAELVDETRKPYWPADFYADCGRSAPPGPNPPHPMDDQPVLVERAGARSTRPDLELERLNDPSLIVLGALQALAMLDLGMTSVAIEWVAGVSSPELDEVMSMLFDDGVPAVAPLGFAWDGRELEGFAGHDSLEGRSEVDRVRELLELGHLRAGALAGAAANGRDMPDRSPEALLAWLRRDELPPSTAYGYAFARSTDVETQLAFARRLIGSRAPTSTDWEIAYAAFCRAIYLLAQEREPSPALWGEALIDTAAVVAKAGEAADGDDAGSSVFADELVRRWRLSPEDLSTLVSLLTLRAVSPAWPRTRWERLLCVVFRRRVHDPPELIPSAPADRELMADFEKLREPLTRFEGGSRWSHLLRAERRLRAGSESAAVHADWILEGA